MSKIFKENFYDYLKFFFEASDEDWELIEDSNKKKFYFLLLKALSKLSPDLILEFSKYSYEYYPILTDNLRYIFRDLMGIKKIPQVLFVKNTIEIPNSPIDELEESEVVWFSKFYDVEKKHLEIYVKHYGKKAIEEIKQKFKKFHQFK